MSEMSERVAGAIREALLLQRVCADGVSSLSGINPPIRWGEVGCAAIEAMKVPTVEMVVAATEEWLCIGAQEDRAEVIWDAMIDAALEESA